MWLPLKALSTKYVRSTSTTHILPNRCCRHVQVCMGASIVFYMKKDAFSFLKHRNIFIFNEVINSYRWNVNFLSFKLYRFGEKNISIFTRKMGLDIYWKHLYGEKSGSKIWGQVEQELLFRENIVYVMMLIDSIFKHILIQSLLTKTQRSWI